MQIAEHNREETKIEGAQASVKVGLSAAKIQEMSRFFRDKIYTHKCLAAIRETVCNAVDEHNKPENKVPKNKRVYVHIPTDSEPWFSCRDFGKGLKEADVFNIFFQYGESTKTQDRLSIGGFGIGAKAPFAYVKQFFVTSWFQGEKKIYLGVDQGQDCTANLAHSEASNEPSGIEVKWDVERHNIRGFKEEFTKFYNYFKTYAELDFNIEVVTDDYYDQLMVRKMRRSNSGRKRVLHKGVVYAADAAMGYNRDFDVYVPDGVRLEISQSRETIDGTEHNKNTLEALMVKYAQERIQALDALWPKDDFEAWEFGIKNAEEVNFLIAFGYTKRMLPEYFYGRFNGADSTTKVFECHAGVISANYGSGNKSYRIEPNSKILFLHRFSMSEGLRQSLCEVHGDNWTAVCCKSKKIKDPAQITNVYATAYVSAEYTMQDLLAGVDLRGHKIDLSRLFHDCRDIKPKVLPRAPKEIRGDLETLVCFQGEWGSRQLKLEDTEYCNHEIYYVNLNGHETDFHEKEKLGAQINEAIEKLSKQKNIAVVGIRKNARKRIPAHWQNIMPLVKAMRRNADRVGDWGVNANALDSKDKNLLVNLGMKVPELPRWPFKPNPKKIKPSEYNQKVAAIVEKHKKLKTTDVVYAACWAVLAGEQYWNLDFSLGKPALTAKIKELIEA